MTEMGRRTKIGRAGSVRGWGVSLLVLAGLCGGLIVAPISAHAGKALTRLSAEITAVDGNAIKLPSTTEPSDGGILIYSNEGKAPAGDTVVYVTISGEGLTTCTNDGIALLCQVDGVNCVPGNATPGASVLANVADIPAGWVIPLGDEFGDLGDLGLTGVNFQWCAPIEKTKKNKHTVKIFASSAFGFCNAFLEGVHIYVDTNQISTKDNGANACGTIPTPNPATSPD